MSSCGNKAYAEILLEIIEGEKDSIKAKKKLKKFLDFLTERKDMKRIERIIESAEDLFYRRTGKKKITIETARKLSNINVFRDSFGKGDVIMEKLNPSLVAGVKIIINNDKQLDFSLKKKLESIF